MPVSLIYLTRAARRSPAIRAKLVEELRTLPPGFDDARGVYYVPGQRTTLLPQCASGSI